MNDQEHKWAPLSPSEVFNLLENISIPWWIAGGWAIDLFIGHKIREHKDIEILIKRKDQLMTPVSLNFAFLSIIS